MQGKTAKVKNLLSTGKSNKSNIGISISKPAVKSNVSVPETRSKSTKLVSGVRIQGPFKGRTNVNSQPHQNSSLLKNNGDPKKSSAKPLPRQSVTTRASLVSKSNIQKPAKLVKNTLEKFDFKIGKVNNSSVTDADNLSIVEPAILLSKLKLRTSTHSGLHDENISKGPPLRRSLRNHIENNEISVQSLIPMFEPKNENQLPVSIESEGVKLRRSLRLTATAEETEIPSQTVNENKLSEKRDPSPKKLRRSSRNIAQKSTSSEIANKSHICDENDEKCLESELVVTLRKSLPDSAHKNEVSFQVYVEDQSLSESKVLRRSSRLSTRKSLTSDKSTENGSLYISALEDM